MKVKTMALYENGVYYRTIQATEEEAFRICNGLDELIPGSIHMYAPITLYARGLDSADEAAQ